MDETLTTDRANHSDNVPSGGVPSLARETSLNDGADHSQTAWPLSRLWLSSMGPIVRRRNARQSRRTAQS